MSENMTLTEMKVIFDKSSAFQKRQLVSFCLSYNHLSRFVLSVFDKEPEHVNIDNVVKQLAHNYQFHTLALIFEKFIHSIRRETLLKIIDILRNILFNWNFQSYSMIHFQRCCFLLKCHFTMSEKFIRVMARLYEQNVIRSQRRLYFWWISICYDVKRDCGKRMMDKSWRRVKDMYAILNLA